MQDAVEDEVGDERVLVDDISKTGMEES